MKKEVESHTKNEVWKVLPKDTISPGTKVLPAVLASKNAESIHVNI
jgi:hypothetical protein